MKRRVAAALAILMWAGRGWAGEAQGADFGVEEKPFRLELSAGPNWLYGPTNVPNYGGGVSYTPLPVLSFGLTVDRPGYGTVLFGHAKLAPLAHVWPVSPYAIAGYGRQWVREVGFDLQPQTVYGKAAFLGAGLDVRVNQRLIVFAEARISGLARSGNDGDPVGGAKLGIRLGF